MATKKVTRRGRNRDRIPGKTSDRGYGHMHQQLRKAWATRVAMGGVRCARCNELIIPGTRWDLGHLDHDRTRYAGPEHARCNRRAGGAEGNRRRHGTLAQRPTSRDW